MKPFNQTHILVTGDIMLDQYWHGETHRTSPEAPVPIVHIRNDDYRIGGAGNVALNIQALSGQATLMGIVGKDEAATKIRTQLEQAAIQHTLIASQAHPTITKLRVISHKQQMIRLDFEEKWHDFNKTPLLEKYEHALAHHQAVVLSDYAKGTLSECQQMIQAARAQQRPVFIDPKGNDFFKYQEATLIKPNRKEFETIVGECRDKAEIETKAQHLLTQLHVQALLITCGADGMVLIEKDQPPYWVSATSKDLADVTGAGDTVIATLATAYASGYDLKAATYIANLAAGLVVSKLGTATVSRQELIEAYHNQHSLISGILTRQALKEAVLEAQKQGQTVVFTNGCFDLLHIGHVSYLKKAKTLGDKLIVAVNDDESIKRLKGPHRPISPLASRMAVLAALESVDWVVAFDEDTPEDLLKLIRPDILVKGTDYQLDEIVGADIVLEYGGQVERIAHDHQNISTSQLIQNANKDICL